MELSTFLIFVILILLIIASEILTRNIGVLLDTSNVCFPKYNLLCQEHHVTKQVILVPDTNHNSILQKEKLYEITPKDTLDNGSPIPKILTTPMQDFSSTKNYCTKSASTEGLTITNCSTETDDAYSFLQKASSEASKDFSTLLRKPETSLDWFKKENDKGLELPIILTGSSENELRKHSVMEIPVDKQSVCTLVRKVPDGEIFNMAKSKMVVEFSLGDLESSVVDIPTLPCPVATGTLQVGTTDRTELVHACDIEEKESFEVGYSANNDSSSDIPDFIAEDTSFNECETGNTIKEGEIYEISLIKQSSLSTVPIEFLYPCLPYFNP